MSEPDAGQNALPTHEPQAGAPPRRRDALSWLPMSLAVAAIAAAGWTYHHFDRMLREQAQAGQSEFTAMRRQLEDANKRLAAAAQSSQALEENASRDFKTLFDSQTKLAGSIALIEERQPRTGNEWMLREVQYLLTVAQQRLLLEHDVTTAAVALEAADRRLADSSDPAFIPIREQLIHDLDALRAVKPVDIAGLALYLADLIGRVESLPLRDGGYAIKAPAAAKRATGNWREVLHSIWTDLVKLVDVKEMSVPDEVIFNPDRRYLLLQNLRLELAAARLEVLRHDTENLRASLRQVEELLRRYYDVQSQDVANILETLKQMQQVELAPPLPDLNQSVERVRTQLAHKEPAAAPVR